jgi:hypothetical protein
LYQEEDKINESNTSKEAFERPVKMRRDDPGYNVIELGKDRNDDGYSKMLIWNLKFAVKETFSRPRHLKERCPQRYKKKGRGSKCGDSVDEIS